jgi:hypothetical protein
MGHAGVNWSSFVEVDLMRNFGPWETIRQDVRYALRAMRKNPLFAVTAVLMMVLAIGGNATVFAVVRAVLLKPLEYRDADRLVDISGGATPTRFAEMEAAAHSFTALGAFTGQENLSLSGGGEPVVLNGARVSASFLGILGVNPILGRGFLPQGDSAGGPPVAMISAELWQQRFGGNPNIVGKTANLEATAYTIIGVLPPHFQFPFPGVNVWMTAPSEWPVMPVKPESSVLS